MSSNQQISIEENIANFELARGNVPSVGQDLKSYRPEHFFTITHVKMSLGTGAVTKRRFKAYLSKRGRIMACRDYENVNLSGLKQSCLENIALIRSQPIPGDHEVHTEMYTLGEPGQQIVFYKTTAQLLARLATGVCEVMPF